MILLKLLIPASILFCNPGLRQSEKSPADTSSVRPDIIRIGLLTDSNNARAARHGAELAIRDANGKGDRSGLKFELVVRSMEGPWGTGSKETVSLIFNENVLAIVGSHDGRNAHLAEQVCAKSGVVYISARASDPTLSQAFVPWYFSTVPNDNQQADLLAKKIIQQQHQDDILLLVMKNYDADQAAKSLIRKVRSEGWKEPVLISYDSSEKDYSALISAVEKSGRRCIAVLGQPPSATDLIRELQKQMPGILIFASLSLQDDDRISIEELLKLEDLFIVSPGHFHTEKGRTFSNEFRKTYGYKPGALAACSYDAVTVITSTVQENGADRDALKDMIAKKRFDGVTGSIEFDERGNRTGPYSLMLIRDGLPVLIR